MIYQKKIDKAVVKLYNKRKELDYIDEKEAVL